MTTTIPLNGQHIGQAERATRAVLDRLLAEHDTTFVEWVAINLLATTGPVVRDDVLVDRIVAGLRVEPPSATGAVAAVVEDGLVGFADGNPTRLELTDAGEARYRTISAGITEISDRLYRDLPYDDLATAQRVLATVTERAKAELAG